MARSAPVCTPALAMDRNCPAPTPVAMIVTAATTISVPAPTDIRAAPQKTSARKVRRWSVTLVAAAAATSEPARAPARRNVWSTEYVPEPPWRTSAAINGRSTLRFMAKTLTASRKRYVGRRRGVQMRAQRSRHEAGTVVVWRPRPTLGPSAGPLRSGLSPATGVAAGSAAAGGISRKVCTKVAAASAEAELKMKAATGSTVVISRPAQRGPMIPPTEIVAVCMLAALGRSPRSTTSRTIARRIGWSIPCTQPRPSTSRYTVLIAGRSPSATSTNSAARTQRAA